MAVMAAGLVWAVTNTISAAIPAPEKLLPEDTLMLLTAPDFAKLREASRRLPQIQCWNDPAFQPFKQRFLSKWDEELVKPLERDLDIKFKDYADLLQGQFTLALIQNGWQGQHDQQPAVLLLLDARDKTGQLKKGLADLRKKWVDAGKSLRQEKIRDVEFSVVTLSSNDMPKTLRKLFPKSSEVEELGDEKENRSARPTELFVGQFESLLMLSDNAKPVEKVVARLTGGAVPALGEADAFQGDYQTRFRDAPLYGWANAKVLLDLITRAVAEKKENPDAPNPFDFKPEKLIAAAGLSGLRTLSFTFRNVAEGGLVELFVGVPESRRQGLLKILAGEAKDTRPPAFVPADAVKFQRWRLDGQKAWVALQKVASDMSPQAAAGINFLLDSANTAARDKDPGFDIRKNLIGNLGDDIITYQKASRGESQPGSRPSLVLLGSPNAEEFAAALKTIFIFFSEQAGTPPEEREFLGRKIYSIKLRLPAGAAAAGGAGSMLSYAASGGYVALSTDSGVLEEYLRASQSQTKALNETPGFSEAAQKVLNPGTSLFGYQDDTETMRATLELLKKSPASATNAPLAGAAALMPGGSSLPGAGQALKSWMDFSLLPPFEKISKYFYFRVYSGSATVDGLSFKVFSPVPPGLRGSR